MKEAGKTSLCWRSTYKPGEYANSGSASETALTNLALERIVRTIYQPAPAQFNAVEIGAHHHPWRPGTIWRLR